jgi:hypothetical protein
VVNEEAALTAVSVNLTIVIIVKGQYRHTLSLHVRGLCGGTKTVWYI